MELNERQKEAVEYLEGPLLVLAGPGTGKTQLLSQKVAHILKNTDASPSEILCLTFTETGAANMRDRIQSLVGPEGAKVTVATYHSFGQILLNKYKNYSPTYSRKIDNVIDGIEQYKLVRSLRDALPATDILRGDKVKDIVEVISAAKSANLTAEDLSLIADTNVQDSKVLSEYIDAALSALPAKSSFPKTVDEIYEPLYDDLEEYKDEAPIVKNIPRSIVMMLKELKSAIDESREIEKMKPLSEWKSKWTEKDDFGRYRLSDRIANQKLFSVAKIMHNYREYLLDHAMIDFSDMILETGKALESDAGFKLTLEEQYQYILLDEFQDTNPAQLMIVKHLTDYEKPLVMAVGDDDQAIFEFQGALSSNLKDFRDYYHAKVIALEENYRSSQEILDFSTDIINEADDRFDPEKTLLAKNPRFKNQTKSNIERHEFASSDQEYAFVAAKILDLVKSGIPQSEIAVLSYKSKYFEPLLNYLKEYPEIKIAYDRRDNLLEVPEIKQILSILKIVDEIASGKNLGPEISEVLTYDFFNIPILTATKTFAFAKREHKNLLDLMQNSTDKNLKSTAEFLISLARIVKTHSANDLIWQIVEKMRIDTRPEEEQFRFYDNLAAFKGKITPRSGVKTVTTSDLLEIITDYNEAEIQISSTSPYREADDAVQIMTAHGAKGLEFEYVFLISVDDTAWGKGKGNNNLLALPKNVAEIRHTGTTDGEKLRILYVALTRAKSHLILTNSVRDYNDKTPKRLEYLKETIEENPETSAYELICPILPEKTVKIHKLGAVQTSDEQGSALEHLKRSVKNLENLVRPYSETPDLRTIYREKVQNYKMTATSLTSFIDLTYAGPQDFFKYNILGAPKEEVGAAALLGTLIHSVFEAVTKENISDNEAKTRFETAVDNEPIEEDEKKDLKERGNLAISESLKTFSRILRQGQAEINLEQENISVAGVPIVGRIDHININEAEKTLEIYDFKTSAFKKEKWDSDASLLKYRLQLGFYKLLLNNSAEYKKYKIEKAHILFVSPDKNKNDGVKDKVYLFNEDDENELIALIKSVYYQITTLKFLDDPDIFLPCDHEKSTNLKKIKEFIALMLAKGEEK